MVILPLILKMAQQSRWILQRVAVPMNPLPVPYPWGWCRFYRTGTPYPHYYLCPHPPPLHKESHSSTTRKNLALGNYKHLKFPFHPFVVFLSFHFMCHHSKFITTHLPSVHHQPSPDTYQAHHCQRTSFMVNVVFSKRLWVLVQLNESCGDLYKKFWREFLLKYVHQFLLMNRTSQYFLFCNIYLTQIPILLNF